MGNAKTLGNVSESGNGKLERRNAIILGLALTLPASAVKDVSFEFSRTVLTQAYGVFLFIYIYWVFWHEYTAHLNLHRLKSPAVDMLLVFGLFFSIREVIAESKDLHTAVRWMVAGLISICAWEIYTMKRGAKAHFGIGRKGRTFRSWFDLLSKPTFSFHAPRKWSHWDEYRYWLTLDASILVLLTIVLFLIPAYLGVESDLMVRLVLALIGVIIGVINIFRYKSVIRANVDF